jgi:hypothetical protein
MHRGVMATAGAPHDPRPAPSEPRAQAPIRWPHRDGPTLRALAVWLLGLAIALGIPALIVPPGADTAPIGKVLTALGFTVLGAGVMLLASYGLYRRHHDALVFVMGGVPAISCIAGGVVIAAGKAFNF